MKKQPYLKILLTTAGLALILGGCSGTKETLGIGSRKAPDEFAVVKRAPLEIPEHFVLAPPRPGAARPQEQKPEETARSVVFGTQAEAQSDNTAAQAAPGTAEAYLLQKTGAVNANPAIRDIVDQEAAALPAREVPVAKKLLGLATSKDTLPAADVVDAKAEAERIRKNLSEGKPVTEGETPILEP